MRYFRLVDDIGSTGVVCKAAELYGFDRKLLLAGEPVNDWDSRVTLLFDRPAAADDYLGNTLNWPVCSDRMGKAILDLGESDIQLLPVRIQNRQSGELLPPYFVLNVLTRLRALDLDRAQYSTSTVRGELLITGVEHYVLKNDVLKGHDVVRLAELRTVVVVSERVKSALESMSITGCVFREVQLS